MSRWFKADLRTALSAYQNLIAALVASACLIVGACLAMSFARHQLRSRAARFVYSSDHQKWRGIAALDAVFAHDDLLPLMGSSEIIFDMPNRARDVFASYPTGFAVVPFGDVGLPPLAMSFVVGAAGSDIRGKRIVVSLSGTWFVGDDTRNDAKTYNAHYSELQVGDVMLRSGLPVDLRRRLARRVLKYEAPDNIDPMLMLAMSCLARRCALEPLLPMLTPLWMLRSLPLRVRDYLSMLSTVDEELAPQRSARALDFATMEARGDSWWRVRTTSNAFGIQDKIWKSDHRTFARVTQNRDGRFFDRMEHAPKWEDLDLLVTTLAAMGARPLILTSPLKGVFWDAEGVSALARERLYQRLDSLTGRHSIPARSFREYDGDPFFLSESRSHLSAKGWAVYDRAINAFYRDSLP